MAQTFVLKDFLRHTSSSFLAEYCRQHKITFDIKDGEDDGETLEQFVTVFNGLTRT